MISIDLIVTEDGKYHEYPPSSATALLDTYPEGTRLYRRVRDGSVVVFEREGLCTFRLPSRYVPAEVKAYLLLTK